LDALHWFKEGKMNKFILAATTFIVVFLALTILNAPKNDKIIGNYQTSPDVIGMPLVYDSNPITSSLFWGAPHENREEQYRRFLAASVKISVSGASGSGTITFYDHIKNEAYVSSCGHLWDGSKTAQELQNNPVKCKIITWYHNGTKLSSPKEYPAQVVFWSNIRGYDSSLIKFTPDWKPDFFPIAPLSYPINIGSSFHSCGCDGGREVARYEIEIVGYRGEDLITTKNSPRPGRSGGGLMSNDGYYIGTCWGTSDTTGGGGIGYFTPLKSIHYVYNKNGYSWLLNISTGLARKIPILDRNNVQGKYDSDYINYPDNGILIPKL